MRMANELGPPRNEWNAGNKGPVDHSSLERIIVATHTR